jgi:hypothetical protein
MDILNKANDGVIDLGIANGWRKETGDHYNALRELMIPGSQSSKELGRCYNEYRFIALYEGQSYVVIHAVDSSD